MPERPSIGSSWMLPLLYGVLLVTASLFWLVNGRFFDRSMYMAIISIPWDAVDQTMPATAQLTTAVVRLSGALGTCAGIVIMGVAATGYRWGERWAWYLLWALPLYATLDLAVLGAYGALTLVGFAWDLLLLALALGGLLVPYRSFFEVGTRDARAHSNEHQPSTPL
jgi:hypothetical protein